MGLIHSLLTLFIVVNRVKIGLKLHTVYNIYIPRIYAPQLLQNQKYTEEHQ